MNRCRSHIFVDIRYHWKYSLCRNTCTQRLTSVVEQKSSGSCLPQQEWKYEIFLLVFFLKCKYFYIIDKRAVGIRPKCLHDDFHLFWKEHNNEVGSYSKTISHNDLQYVMLILTEFWKIIQNLYFIHCPLLSGKLSITSFYWHFT